MDIGIPEVVIVGGGPARMMGRGSSIGDAAHAMSLVGGINLAIQDAVAAANILAGPLARGEEVEVCCPRWRSAA